ncbi:hypothetical protein ACIPY5_16165 [Microbacterium sp. NPDC089698]|uniref:hypothetical protein n=1 Tax=Microbacterium sp. NPDC089698 TaxID=3364200 RepID=UPI0038234597
MARTVAVAPGGVPRVDLLPRSEIERREREALSAVWVRICLLAVLLAAVLIGGAFVWNLFAQQRLSAEQDRSQQLIGQIAALSDVSKALATESELQSFRADAMGSDFAWSGILDKVRASLPAGASLTGFALTPGASPAATSGEDATQKESAAKKALGLTGTLTIDSPTAVDLGSYVRSLRGVTGVLSADANATTSGASAVGRFTYKVDITFDQTVYSGRFAEEAKK